VAVARAAVFAKKRVVLNEFTASLEVMKSRQVLRLIRELRARRLGRRAAMITPQSHLMSETVAIMTGASIA